MIVLSMCAQRSSPLGESLAHLNTDEIRYVFNGSPLPAIEVIHDVVFFQWAPIHPGYLLGETAGTELVGITQYDNPQTLKCLWVNTLTRLRNNPP